MTGGRDIEAEYVVWVRMFGQEEADRLRAYVEAREPSGEIEPAAGEHDQED